MASTQQRMCPACGFAENSVNARFCGLCAQPLPLICANCNATNPPSFKFCGQCASPLSTSAPKQSTRRVVTVLFADVCNYTALTAEIGSERMYTLLDPFLRRLGEVVQRFEGTVDKFTGDGLMAVFGMPLALEQHAIQAAYAALAMFAELQRYNDEIRASSPIAFEMRLALASGEVVAGNLGSDRLIDATVIGEVVNLAARLQQSADPNTVYVNESTASTIDPLFLLEPLEPLTLKGFAERVSAWRLVSKRDQPGLLRGLSGMRTPLVGRTQELAILDDALLSLESGIGGAVVIRGEAGIGKSRITNEMLDRLQSRPVYVYEGDCSSATRTVPYSAFIGVVRDLCGIKSSDDRRTVRSRIAATVNRHARSATRDVIPYLEYLLSIEAVDNTLLERIRHFDPAQLKRQVFLAFRELLLAETRLRPVVLILDDLQWADDVSLELVAYLAEVIDEAPLLLYLIARDDDSPRLQGLIDTVLEQAQQRGRVIQLKRMRKDELRQMVRSLLPDASASVMDVLANYADGVPFYLEELVRHSLEVGLDLQAQTSSDIELDRVPLSLSALLRARFDRLPESLQWTLAQAAVIGRRFALPLLRSLDPAPDLKQRLEQLRERAFIRPRRTSTGEWTFLHLLMQETVYNGLLIEQRRDLHERIGTALEEMSGDRLEEQVDVLAFHFGRSINFPKAVRYGLQAAERAAGRFANEDALRRFERVERIILDAGQPFPHEQVQLEDGRASVLTILGRYDEARAACLRALEVIATIPETIDPSRHALVERHLARTLEKQGQYADALRHLDDARVALGDGSLIEHALIDADAGWISFALGDSATAERLLVSALTLAELEDHHSLLGLAANRLAGLNWQKGDLTAASALVARSLEMSRYLNDLPAVARALNNLGVIALEQVQWSHAEAYFGESNQTYRTIGDINGQLHTSYNGALTTMMQGRFDEALRSLHMTYSLARQTGDQYHMAMARTQEGHISMLVDDLKYARRYLVEALVIFRTLRSHPSNSADVLEHLARVAWVEQRFCIADLLVRKAEKLVTLKNDAMLRIKRTKLFFASMADQFEVADAILEEYLAKEYGNAYERALMWLAVSLHMRNCSKLEEAAAYRAKATALFQQSAIPASLQRIV